VSDGPAPDEGAPQDPAPAAAGAAGGADGVDPLDQVDAEEIAEVGEEDIIDLVDTEESAVDPVARERDEYLDALRRLQADFENYRKRVQKEVADAGDRALGSFVEGLLPVLDAVDAARAHGVAELESVASLLVETLSRQGLERIDPKGDVFDPTRHEAVAHEAGDGSGVEVITEVFRAGWLWKGRVLGAGMVKVAG
jgi:molecular chaperone GrpE